LFIGYTTNLVTGVWLGNDDNSPTRKTTGGGLPVEVWTRFMRAAHQDAVASALPTSWGGGLFSNVADNSAASGATTPPAPIGGSARPAPTQVAQRPASGGGMDGWLLDKLFGKR